MIAEFIVGIYSKDKAIKLWRNTDLTEKTKHCKTQ